MSDPRPTYELVYSYAARANLHRATCSCTSRIHWAKCNVPSPESIFADTLVTAMQSKPITRAQGMGYRIIVSRCAKR